MKKRQYGTQTASALENFPFPLPVVPLEFIYAVVEIKQAAAKANARAGHIEKQIGQAIVEAGEDVLAGKYDDQFVTPSIQGGAGTSVHMNVNEVLATLATEKLQKTSKVVVHPNDHVNFGQSTNDVNPSALRIAALRLIDQLQIEVDRLVNEFHTLGKRYASVPKLARTHVQDALPMMVGQEFESYAQVIYRDLERVMMNPAYLLQLNLGGTAIGTKTNASEAYIAAVYEELAASICLPVVPATNLMSLTSSTSDFAALGSSITILFADLSKIATDLRILSSGPMGGLGELTLANLQPGSSIMPGKVNPVAAESVNQAFYFIAGKNQSMLQASEAACLELAVMFPVILESTLSILRLAIAVIRVFRERGVHLLRVNDARCRELLVRSTALSTLLTPKLGYDVVSALVKESVEKNFPFEDLVIAKKLLSKKEFAELTKI